MKTLYVTDLDGTLLNTDRRLSAETITILNRVIAEGAVFTYATARSVYSASEVTSGLKTHLPVVAHNGGFIVKPATKEILEGVYFSPAESKAVADAILKMDISPIVYSIIDGRERLSWNKNAVNKGMKDYLDSRKGDVRLRPLEGKDGLFDGKNYYFTLIGNKDELKPIYELFKDKPEYTCLFQQELYVEDYWCEIMPAKATKAGGIQRLKEILGCDRVVAFGDGINDKPMFEAADECYAVENAVDELKGIATGVIGSNNEDAVAQWIEVDFMREKEMNSLLDDLRNMGIENGSTILVHSSMKAIGTKLTPQDIISVLQEAVGAEGNLLFPALSYDNVGPDQPVFDSKTTEPCIGLLPKVFHKTKDVKRSLHPTHSVCAWGKDSDALTADHINDNTPVGPNSPFKKIIPMGGKILFIGDVVEHCTFMHGMEELYGTDYVLEDHETAYVVDGITKNYVNHDFRTVAAQCYDRIKLHVPMVTGKFGKADCFLFGAADIKEKALEILAKDQHYFVDLK